MTRSGLHFSKHFCCVNNELARTGVESATSQRAALVQVGDEARGQEQLWIEETCGLWDEGDEEEGDLSVALRCSV